MRRIPRKKKKFLATKKAGFFKISVPGILKLPVVTLSCNVEDLQKHHVETFFIQEKDLTKVRLYEKDVYFIHGEMVSDVMIPQSNLPLRDNFYRCAVPTSWLVKI